VTPGIGEATWTGFAPTIIIFGPEQASGDIVHTVKPVIDAAYWRK
jgi:hypothetical protein